jgi:uncharacterized protein (DUF433 family)
MPGSGKAKPISFRLDANLLDELKRGASERGIPTTTLLERYLAEGIRHDAHPLIVFRDGAAGRRPALAGTRLDVWQVVDTIAAAEAKGEPAMREAAEYLGLTYGQVRACVAYYAAYKSEVDEWRERMHAIAERERDAWSREQAVLA